MPTCSRRSGSGWVSGGERGSGGEPHSLGRLLRSTGDITNTLADRDELIGDVITNLNVVLKTIGDRDQELSGLRRSADHRSIRPNPPSTRSTAPLM